MEPKHVIINYNEMKMWNNIISNLELAQSKYYCRTNWIPYVITIINCTILSEDGNKL